MDCRVYLRNSIQLPGRPYSTRKFHLTVQLKRKFSLHTMFSIAKQDRENGCPVAAMTRLLGSRWTMLIIHHLRAPRRYRELQTLVGEVNPATFTQRLRLLEQQGLIVRRANPENSRHVEYALTPQGAELLPILDELAAWARRWSRKGDATMDATTDSDRNGFGCVQGAVAGERNNAPSPPNESAVEFGAAHRRKEL
jgi:DNA-binding HxlR family transcriptional regulator